MKKIEQKLTTEFQKWLKHNWDETSAFEVKVARDGKRFPYRELYDHQIRNLQNAKKKIIHKMPDMGFENLFDLFVLSNASAFVVLFYYVSHKKKEFFVIDIDNFINEMNCSDTASMSEDTAKRIASFTGILK